MKWLRSRLSNRLKNRIRYRLTCSLSNNWKHRLRNSLHEVERGFFTYMALILGTILLLFWSAIGETMHTLISMTHDEVGLTTMNYYAEGVIGCLLRTYSEKGDSMPTGREVTYEESKERIVTYILTPPSAFNDTGDFRVAYRNTITGQQVRYYVVFKEAKETKDPVDTIDGTEHVGSSTSNVGSRTGNAGNSTTNVSNSTAGRKQIMVERVSRIQ